MRLTAHEKGLGLVVKMPPGAPGYLLGDPTGLRQVLLNLVTNAIKFTAHGHVRLEVIVDGSGRGVPPHLRFEVSDTGIGVAPDAVGRIFQSFTQADVSTTGRDAAAEEAAPGKEDLDDRAARVPSPEGAVR